jgi:hypothetical protein
LKGRVLLHRTVSNKIAFSKKIHKEPDYSPTRLEDDYILYFGDKLMKRLKTMNLKSKKALDSIDKSSV